MKFWRMLILLAFASSWAIGAQALTPDDLKPLGADDFDAKAQLIAKLVTTGDAASLTVLKALADDAVSIAGNNEILIQDGDNYRDAITGRAVTATDAQPITLSNVLRNQVNSGLSAVQLSSPDLATRQAAVETLLQNPEESLKPLVDQARSRETDAALKKRLDTLWAMTALHNHDPAQRLQAVLLLNARHNLEVGELLRPLLLKNSSGAYAEPDPAVRHAAQAGLDELASIQRRGEIAGTIFAGLSLGSVLLLAALGLAITYGLIGVINMAHGEFLTIGAYTTYVLSVLTHKYAPALQPVYFFVAVMVAFAVAFAFGYLVEWLLIRHLYRRPLDTLLATWGLSLAMQQTFRSVFGSEEVSPDLPQWLMGSLSPYQGLDIPINGLMVMVVTLVLTAVLLLFLYKSQWGVKVRATTQNRVMAGAIGINTGKVDRLTFALGCGIAGIAGAAFTTIGSTGPTSGSLYIVDTFLTVVFGGAQSLFGTIASAFSIAQTQSTTEFFLSGSMAKVLTLSAVIVILMLRPQGLFATKVRR